MTDAPPETNPSGLELLLRALHQDRDEAAVRYEKLRRKLVKFFSWEQCIDSEELADICLDRVGRKLQEGAAIENLQAYAGGVARLVLREHHSREERARVVLREFTRRQELTARDSDQLTAGLERCLQQLSPENRALVRRYYEGSQQDRIRNRQALADELNLSLNALRNRAMRLRGALERCMQSGGDTSPKKTTRVEKPEL